MAHEEKITARHLSRTGYVYIRQSTAYQVMANTESALCQYALKDRLLSFGWDDSLIDVIDEDLGITGKYTEGRTGFKRLMADVANGLAGAIACIEASRLSRCSADWARLIEICSMTDVLLIDSDGVYSPNDFNDRLLLGLKGTMSEAELHFLTERMKGGLLNKAKRGELRRYLPIGYEYDLEDRVVKCSDMRILEAVEQFFSLFQRRRMYTIYHYYPRFNKNFPVYACSSTRSEGPVGCRHTVPSLEIDAAISKTVLNKLTPEVLKHTAEVSEEVSRRRNEHIRYFELQLEKARHEEMLARSRYMSVDPANRLVAVQLEADWNKRLREYDEAVKKYEDEQKKKEGSSGTDLTEAISAVCENIGSVWESPDTRHEDKKRIVRYLIKDVAVKRADNYTAVLQINFQGGATEEIEVPVPKPRWMKIATPEKVLEYIREKSKEYPYDRISGLLNENGYTRECGRPFHPKNVHRIMTDYGIPSLKQRYIEKDRIFKDGRHFFLLVCGNSGCCILT